jgi:hypothetical protein
VSFISIAVKIIILSQFCDRGHIFKSFSIAVLTRIVGVKVIPQRIMFLLNAEGLSEGQESVRVTV